MTVPNDVRRNKSRSWIGGVCAGVAEYFAVSPFWLRLVFFLWSLSSGLAVPGYVLLWLLLPDEVSQPVSWTTSVHANARDILTEGRRWRRDLQALWDRERPAQPVRARRVVALGGGLTVSGLLILADRLSLFGPFHLHHLWPLAAMLLGAAMLNRAARM
jgi:phage shock protein PspC (stress-responsive transcriptional regulator)